MIWPDLAFAVLHVAYCAFALGLTALFSGLGGWLQ